MCGGIIRIGAGTWCPCCSLAHNGHNLRDLYFKNFTGRSSIRNTLPVLSTEVIPESSGSRK